MARIRVVTRDNQSGLSRDLRLVRDVLAAAGHTVECVGYGNEKGLVALQEHWLRLTAPLRPRVDVQVFLERVHPRLMPLAPRNVLVPNAEWVRDDWRPWLPRFDAVLCKTRHALELFAAQGCRVGYVGFTSDDRLDPSVPREHAFLHVAGRSSAKGTAVLVEAWLRHPEWPRLTIVQSTRKAQPVSAPNIDHRIGHIDDAELRRLQNAHVFHACPSEMEGFGHVLMEALSVGAVQLTTDGAPMNELVRPDRGVLVPPVRTATKDLSPRFFVDADGVERAVAALLALDDGEVAAMRAAARAYFESADAAFRARLPAAVLG